MSMNKRRKIGALLLALTLGLAGLAEPLLADCNGGGCYFEYLKQILINADGKIWFVTTTSANLTALQLADGCQLRTVWTGSPEPALYIRPDDPEYDQKYTMLLTAFTTGKSIGFAPVKDPATGWCSLDYLYIR